MISEMEAEDHLCLERGELAELRELYAGPAYYKVGRHIRYKPEDLDAWVEAQRYGTLEQMQPAAAPVRVVPVQVDPRRLTGEQPFTANIPISGMDRPLPGMDTREAAARAAAKPAQVIDAPEVPAPVVCQTVDTAGKPVTLPHGPVSVIYDADGNEIRRGAPAAVAIPGDPQAPIPEPGRVFSRPTSPEYPDPYVGMEPEQIGGCGIP